MLRSCVIPICPGLEVSGLLPLPAYSLEGKGLTQHHGIQFTTAGVWHGTGF